MHLEVQDTSPGLQASRHFRISAWAALAEAWAASIVVDAALVAEVVDWALASRAKAPVRTIEVKRILDGGDGITDIK
jgi:hypothetical protein